MGKQDSEPTENNTPESDKEESGKETPHVITITEEKSDVQQPQQIQQLQQQQSQQQQQTQQSQPQEQPVQNIIGPTQKKFKCGLCVKTYMYLHSLKKHMLSHMTVIYHFNFPVDN